MEVIPEHVRSISSKRPASSASVSLITKVVSNLNHNSFLGDKNADTKIKELIQMKHTGNILSANVIETLINETLSDAEHLDIPGMITKPSHKQPLERY